MQQNNLYITTLLLFFFLCNVKTALCAQEVLVCKNGSPGKRYWLERGDRQKEKLFTYPVKSLRNYSDRRLS